ncbi:MAG: hypothetical protein ACXADU_16335 [Promethearchaeota archaeon]
MNKKIFRLFIIFFFVVAIVGTATAWPSHMIEWEKADHGSCHFGSYTVGSGGLMATVTPSGTKAPGQQFTVVIDINGFTEAADEHVLVGVSARLADNNEFFLGVQEDAGAYYAEGIEVGLDSSGNANNTVSLVFFAPAEDGNYTLSIIAAEGGESFPTAHAFDYLELLLDVEVVTPTGGGGAIPGFDIFIILSVGLITAAPIVLMVLRKRRKNERR